MQAGCQTLHQGYQLHWKIGHGMSLWPTQSEEGRSIPGAEPIRRISVLPSFNWSLFWTSQTFTSEIQIRWSVQKWMLQREDQICTVQYHPQTCDERRWLITPEWAELVPGQSLGGPQKSEVKERILLHSQLLLVSYLAGKNSRRTMKARSQIPKVFSRWVRRQRLDPEWRLSQNLKHFSQEVIENTNENCLSAAFWAISWLEGVPKIILKQMTKKQVKNNFVNKFGHEGHIWNRPKVFKHIWFKGGLFQRGLNDGCFHTGKKMAADKDSFTMAVSVEQSRQNTRTVRTLELGQAHMFYETFASWISTQFLWWLSQIHIRVYQRNDTH